MHGFTCIIKLYQSRSVHRFAKGVVSVNGSSGLAIILRQVGASPSALRAQMNIFMCFNAVLRLSQNGVPIIKQRIIANFESGVFVCKRDSFPLC